ncbi:MAG: hypothetical protein ACKVVO_05825, partial [Opitutaceae bacterium]
MQPIYLRSLVCRALAPVVVMVVTVGATVAQAAVPPEKLALLPRASTARVDFARDIQPIFEASCVQCHGRGKNKGSFSLETRED